MSVNELRNEVSFGLENLEKIYRNILSFAQQEIDQRVKVSALAFECLGYYNAIEHLIIRTLKHLRIVIPSGQFSHRDTLRVFETWVSDRGIEVDEETIKVIENLMAFRHVATKIYGFLVDWDKLQVIVSDIEANHKLIKQLFTRVLDAIQQ